MCKYIYIYIYISLQLHSPIQFGDSIQNDDSIQFATRAARVAAAALRRIACKARKGAADPNCVEFDYTIRKNREQFRNFQMYFGITINCCFNAFIYIYLFMYI